ncbi:Putative inorganic phosphate cotransporter [Gryllus bimaculatus]|nr:Putative inorganic phosphate cotransporter [Gryllus bimaculatus]
MLFLCLAVAYALRVILSVAIVAMCRDCGDEKDINDDFPAYDWSSKKDTILSSFFWGYVVTQVPGGIVAQRVGGAPLLVASLGLTSAVSLLTPLAADGGWGWMCAGRVVQGLAQGLVFPSVGTIVAMASSGALAASAIGWPSIFYIFGSVGVGWAVLWFFLGGNSPATHRWCSERERTYIEESLGDTSAIVRPPTPWGKIMTSVPMWSLIIVHCGQNWGFWTLLTEMPSYMNSVLGFELSKASAVALLTVAVGLDAATYVGFQVNHIDLSPNFAGSMMGVTNCAANIMSIIGPLLVGVLSNREAWRVVFFLASGIYFVGNLLFVIFGSAELQPWNTPTETRGNDEEKPTEKSEQDGN